MSIRRWIAFLVGWGLIAVTACFLNQLRHVQHLGKPGVRVGQVSLYGTDGKVVASNSVVLPDEVLGGRSVPMPITKPELTGLPKDTTFGRRVYRLPDRFEAMISVVLMGADRTSIHQPEFCLVGQGWSIIKSEQMAVHLQQPFAYEVPAMKLTTSIRVKDKQGNARTIHGLYIYWFVSGDSITDSQGQRMWSIARTMVEKGVLERWAYISYFATCAPGQEDATCRRLEEFIGASAPDFQLVAGHPAGGLSMNPN